MRIAAIFLVVFLVWMNWKSRTLDWNIVSVELRRWRLPQAIGALFMLHAAFVLRAARWRLLTPSPISMKHSIEAVFLGFTAIFFVGRFGEVYRAKLLAERANRNLAFQLMVLAWERAFDLLGILATMSLLLSREAIAGPWSERSGVTPLTILLLLALAALIVLIGPRVIDRISMMFPRLSQGAAESSKPSILQSSMQAKMAASAYSLMLWLAVAYAYLLAARASGLDLPFYAGIMLMSASLLGNVAPLPGNAAAYPAIASLLVAVFRIPAEQSIAAATTIWFLTQFAPVPVGLSLFLNRIRKRRSRSKDKSVETQ